MRDSAGYARSAAHPPVEKSVYRKHRERERGSVVGRYYYIDG